MGKTSSFSSFNRRAWWKFLISFGAGACAYPVGRYVGFLARGASATTVAEMVIKDRGAVSIGDSFLTRFNGRIILLIHRGDQDWVALDGICTHMGCPLHYDSQLKQIVCVCHKGRYDLSGKVLEGPPPRPLRSYPVEERADALVVHS